MYHDETLNALMQELLAFNPSIAKYEALYKQALATVESSRASLFPTLSLGASATKSQTTSNGSNQTHHVSSKPIKSFCRGQTNTTYCKGKRTGIIYEINKIHSFICEL
jgi:outer membrane protein TolC